MRRFSDLLTPNLCARVAVAALLAWLMFSQPFAPAPRLSLPGEGAPQVPWLEFVVESPQPGSVSVRIDEGHGVATNRPARIHATFDQQQAVSLSLPAGQIHALRITFYSTPGVTLRHLQFVTDDGIKQIDPRLATATAGTTGRLMDDRIELTTPSGGPITVEVTFPSPL